MEGAAGAMGEHECIGRGTIAQGEGVLIDDRTGEGGQPVRVKGLGRGAAVAVSGVVNGAGLTGGGVEDAENGHEAGAERAGGFGVQECCGVMVAR